MPLMEQRRSREKAFEPSMSTGHRCYKRGMGLGVSKVLESRRSWQVIAAFWFVAFVGFGATTFAETDPEMTGFFSQAMGFRSDGFNPSTYDLFYVSYSDGHVRESCVSYANAFVSVQATSDLGAPRGRPANGVPVAFQAPGVNSFIMAPYRESSGTQRFAVRRMLNSESSLCDANVWEDWKRVPDPPAGMQVTTAAEGAVHVVVPRRDHKAVAAVVVGTNGDTSAQRISLFESKDAGASWVWRNPSSRIDRVVPGAFIASMPSVAVYQGQFRFWVVAQGPQSFFLGQVASPYGGGVWSDWTTLDVPTTDPPQTSVSVFESPSSDGTSTEQLWVSYMGRSGAVHARVYDGRTGWSNWLTVGGASRFQHPTRPTIGGPVGSRPVFLLVRFADHTRFAQSAWTAGPAWSGFTTSIGLPLTP